MDVGGVEELQHAVVFRRKILAGIGAWRRDVGATRITASPCQMGGAPCLRSLRIPVATVIAMIADRMSEEEILKVFPDLKSEDIREALLYASEAVREQAIPLLATS
jgi:uncharacterized protein (DUF433 family)